VLCFRTVWESTAQSPERRASLVGGGHSRISGDYQWQVPFGAQSAANWVAMMAMRHFHEFGTTREQPAAIALDARANAARNPQAIFRKPLTLDDYLAARMISDPLGLYDCDIPMEGSTAVVVSAPETAPDLRQPLVRVEAIGCALRGCPSWDQFDDLTTMAARDGAAMLWSRTDLKPRDVDIAELYDGFSFLTIVWPEALGFCPKGEGGRFIEGGKRIDLNGEPPLNTNGGQLSAGRLHGYGFLHEACTQLRGAAGDRQVASAAGR
jgi:acetyl-CoA acetyltransferase